MNQACKVHRSSLFLYSLMHSLICFSGFECAFLIYIYVSRSCSVFFFYYEFSMNQYTSDKITHKHMQFNYDRLTGFVSRYNRYTLTCFRDEGALFGRPWRPPLLASAGSLQLLLRVGAVTVPESGGWDSGFR